MLSIEKFKNVEVVLGKLKKSYSNFYQEMSLGNFVSWCVDIGMEEIENRYKYDLSNLLADTVADFKSECFSEIIENLKDYGSLDNIDDSGLVHEYSDNNVPIYNYDLEKYAQYNGELRDFENYDLLCDHDGDFTSKVGVTIFSELHDALYSFTDSDFDNIIELLENIEGLKDSDSFNDIEVDKLLIDDKDQGDYMLSVEKLNNYINQELADFKASL